LELFKTYLGIALGSALGGMARFGIGSFVDRQTSGTFPWGTVLVNISGCFLIGLFAQATSPEGRAWINPQWRLLLMVGVCGGYTTFSSFSLQTLNQLRDGDVLKAVMHVLLSVLLCLAATWGGEAAGMLAGR
jgi:CrcB protein